MSGKYFPQQLSLLYLHISSWETGCYRIGTFLLVSALAGLNALTPDVGGL